MKQDFIFDVKMFITCSHLGEIPRLYKISISVTVLCKTIYIDKEIYKVTYLLFV